MARSSPHVESASALAAVLASPAPSSERSGSPPYRLNAWAGPFSLGHSHAAAALRPAEGWKTLPSVQLFQSGEDAQIFVLHVYGPQQKGFLFRFCELLLRHTIEIESCEVEYEDTNEGDGVRARFLLRAPGFSGTEAKVCQWCREVEDFVRQCAASEPPRPEDPNTLERLSVNPDLLSISCFKEIRPPRHPLHAASGVAASLDVPSPPSPNSHERRYVLELEGINQTGLLAYLSLVFFRCHFDITSVHIRTPQNSAVGKFTLTATSATSAQLLRTYLDVPYVGRDDSRDATSPAESVHDESACDDTGLVPLEPEQHRLVHYPNGDVYDGACARFQEGLTLHGMGTYWYHRETHNFFKQYRGEWRRGRKHGQGVLLYQSGGIYTGGWSRNCRHGQGVLLDYGSTTGKYYSEDACSMPSHRYEGQWAEDEKHGLGVEETCLDAFFGLFERGQRSGRGVRVLFGADGHVAGCEALVGSAWCPLLEALGEEALTLQDSSEGEFTPARVDAPSTVCADDGQRADIADCSVAKACKSAQYPCIEEACTVKTAGGATHVSPSRSVSPKSSPMALGKSMWHACTSASPRSSLRSKFSSRCAAASPSWLQRRGSPRPMQPPLGCSPSGNAQPLPSPQVASSAWMASPRRSAQSLLQHSPRLRCSPLGTPAWSLRASSSDALAPMACFDSPPNRSKVASRDAGRCAMRGSSAPPSLYGRATIQNFASASCKGSSGGHSLQIDGAGGDAVEFMLLEEETEMPLDLPPSPAGSAKCVPRPAANRGRGDSLGQLSKPGTNDTAMTTSSPKMSSPGRLPSPGVSDFPNSAQLGHRIACSSSGRRPQRSPSTNGCIKIMPSPAVSEGGRRCLTPEGTGRSTRAVRPILCPMFWSEDELAAFLSCLGLGGGTACSVRRRKLRGVDQLVQMSDRELHQEFNLRTDAERLVARTALKRFLELDRMENSALGRRLADLGDDPVLRQFLIPLEEVTLGEEIAQGGFGRVYKGALRPKTDRGRLQAGRIHPVALKDMKGNRNARLHEMLKEGRILASLNHQNICMFVGVACSQLNARGGGKQYIVTELMDCSLFDLVHLPYKLRWYRELTLDIALRLADGMCAGVVYLHSRKLVHADLKSSNILIDYTSSVNLIPKICDFGHVAVRTHPTPHRQCGTPHWAAPEVLRSEALGPAADVFSCGVMIWEMLARAPPHRHLTFGQVIGAVGWARWIPDLDDLPPAPPALRELLERSLKFLPAERPSSYELRKTLRRILRAARHEATRHLCNFFLG